jgi:predicted MFS family arabinose efflux permease
MLPEARGTAMAGFSSALFIGQSVGVAVGAMILDRAGSVPVFVVAALAWLALAVWLTRRIARR